MKQSRKLKRRTKKFLVGTTKKKGTMLNIKRERMNQKKKRSVKKRPKPQIKPIFSQRGSSQSENNTSNNTIDFTSLFESQNNNTATAINSLSKIPTSTIQSLEENTLPSQLSQSSISPTYQKALSQIPPTPYPSPVSLNENNYRLKNTTKARGNFNNLRKEIKENENINSTMFKYGKPTKLINDFLYSLYNENMISLFKHENPKDNHNFMMSVAELKSHPNTLYITISEEPQTDELFYEKMGKLLHLLEIMLLKDKYMINDKRLLKNGGEFQSENYIYANGRITILDVNQDNIDKINDSRAYSNGYRYFNEKFNKMYTFTPKKSSRSKKVYDDYRTIIPIDLKINVVFNNTYISQRNKSEISLSYRPFLKADKDNKDFVACNSGSICSESKLFSYLHDKNLFGKKKKKNIQGAIAYWVGKGTNFGRKCHPNGKVDVKICNYHPNYSYEKKESGEDLLDNMIRQLKNDDKLSRDLLSKNTKGNKLLFKNVFRAFALPCPGCYLNEDAYLNDKRILWNNSKCLENRVNKRTAAKLQQRAAELHPGE